MFFWAKLSNREIGEAYEMEDMGGNLIKEICERNVIHRMIENEKRCLVC